MKEEKSAVAAEQAAQQEMGELLRIRRDKLAALQQEDKNPFCHHQVPCGPLRRPHQGRVCRHRQ